MRRLISGELTIYSVVRTSPEPLQKLLLDKGADVNAKGGYYGNALQAASGNGHEQVGWLVGIHFTSS
jgi:hypothetical protein